MKRVPFAPFRPQEALIYMAGAAYLFLKAGYDAFIRHDMESVAGDVLGLFLGVFFVWSGRLLWKRYLQSKKKS
jgi:hypothetical protein